MLLRDTCEDKFIPGYHILDRVHVFECGLFFAFFFLIYCTLHVVDYCFDDDHHDKVKIKKNKMKRITQMIHLDIIIILDEKSKNIIYKKYILN